MPKQLLQTRSIGPWGTGARLIVGVALLVGAALAGVDAGDALLGLVAFPAVVVTALLVRGGRAAPLRLTGAASCSLVCALGVVGLVVAPEATLLFVGATLLLAAARGYGGCELLATSNWLLRRDDQMACPLFSPIDAAEARAHRVPR